ncbi:MAG TPA: DEAD/DEAH box helicase [Anaerolineales bacterium]|nr:DEAD/DEAH box helicase [Anaerolineales bacterium]
MTTEFFIPNLQPQILQAVADLGYTAPTPIQSAVIPLMVAGLDVIGQAQTGTGKTAAFSLPVLHNLRADQGSVQALVLVPTRELALQVSKAISAYGQRVSVRVLAVYGGQSYQQQISRLRRGVDVVVGTPGRLLDLMQKKALDLSQVRTVVLDEADEMLSMGFIEDIEAILSTTPRERQTALFSATLPPGIRQLSERFMHAPQHIAIHNEQLTVAAIEQRYYVANEADKLAALTRLFEVEEISSALIFTRTRVGTGELANELTVRGFPAEALNGDLSQDMREQTLRRFREGQIKVLVATDVAARGLDIEDISHVFIYDLPDDPELYVHRVGRTGRAGKTGIAIMLVTPKELWRLRRIEKFARQTITRLALPSTEDIERYRQEKLISKVKIWLQRGRCQKEREIVSALVAEDYDALEIAAVALKLAREDEKQRPIAPISEVREVAVRAPKMGTSRPTRKFQGKRSERTHSKHSHEEGMVRLTLNKGKKHGLRTSQVVNAIASQANIPGYTLGKINIFEQHTSVDVPEELVPQVLAQSKNYRLHKQPFTVSVA